MKCFLERIELIFRGSIRANLELFVYCFSFYRIYFRERMDENLKRNL
ncbi:hypothetical protein LEP1GSC021_1861 [Leptospira noguchii str. 1993005606]|uniref:Lipoprotein n=1 Tax=Leptospira noguchii str. 2007001578 TaxID=1049974 RepID=A0ABN0J165_9LEPT|nr:hypothetical protein LEP1GSC035_1847 [Leptospira noguchii str. 2007001578]EPE82081.1 hypothetical protein LEP1GSC021_1861 [Leptospira noguchii str. 1993005606]